MPIMMNAQISVDEKFLIEFREMIRAEIGKAKSEAVEKPLTREEAAAYMRIDPVTLDRRLRKGTLPMSLRHHNGGTLYFFASELEAFLKKS